MICLQSFRKKSVEYFKRTNSSVPVSAVCHELICSVYSIIWASVSIGRNYYIKS
jgi:hypothetical protein